MRAHQSYRRAAALFWMVIVLCGLSAGCATTGDNDSDLPWNTPQSWEGSPAIPGFDGER